MKLKDNHRIEFLNGKRTFWMQHVRDLDMIRPEMRKLGFSRRTGRAHLLSAHGAGPAHLLSAQEEEPAHLLNAQEEGPAHLLSAQEAESAHLLSAQAAGSAHLLSAQTSDWLSKIVREFVGPSFRTTETSLSGEF
ncbi:hypothetical protein L1987_62511 [Smallanthus sonchifolius]|uniref:Uncharacterized protein n=1 Tax=Smallanthus sonchifolius TaxID=185202 RepID=A0ACB9CAQ4_9ASTR|nr:hypothetical protein L1987_62511 [Smallanthus sonchifolius]